MSGVLSVVRLHDDAAATPTPAAVLRRVLCGRRAAARGAARGRGDVLGRGIGAAAARGLGVAIAVAIARGRRRRRETQAPGPGDGRATLPRGRGLWGRFGFRISKSDFVV